MPIRGPPKDLSQSIQRMTSDSKQCNTPIMIPKVNKDTPAANQYQRKSFGSLNYKQVHRITTSSAINTELPKSQSFNIQLNPAPNDTPSSLLTLNKTPFSFSNYPTPSQSFNIPKSDFVRPLASKLLNSPERPSISSMNTQGLSRTINGNGLNQIINNVTNNTNSRTSLYFEPLPRQIEPSYPVKKTNQYTHSQYTHSRQNSTKSLFNIQYLNVPRFSVNSPIPSARSSNVNSPIPIKSRQISGSNQNDKVRDTGGVPSSTNGPLLNSWSNIDVVMYQKYGRSSYPSVAASRPSQRSTLATGSIQALNQNKPLPQTVKYDSSKKEIVQNASPSKITTANPLLSVSPQTNATFTPNLTARQAGDHIYEPCPGWEKLSQQSNRKYDEDREGSKESIATIPVDCDEEAVARLSSTEKNMDRISSDEDKNIDKISIIDNNYIDKISIPNNNNMDKNSSNKKSISDERKSYSTTRSAQIPVTIKNINSARLSSNSKSSSSSPIAEPSPYSIFQ